MAPGSALFDPTSPTDYPIWGQDLGVRGQGSGSDVGSHLSDLRSRSIPFDPRQTPPLEISPIPELHLGRDSI